MKMFLKAAALVAVSVLTACGGADRYVLADENRVDAIRSDAPALTALGTYSVGVKTLSFTNPNQLDIAKAKQGDPTPTYNRPLTVEVWYPATLAPGQSAAGEYRAMTRDGKTMVSLYGKAVRNAEANKSGGPYPLIIMSHGYPGNRFLLSHLGENLSSKGYVVVSIDHTDSTYESQLAFGSTLVNRSLDQLFVLNQMAQLNTSDPGKTLQGMVNATNTALIGYSMGAYGALNTVGAGVSATAVSWGAPNGALAIRQQGNSTYQASLDSRIKAVVAIAPWGKYGMWDAAGLAGITVPVLYMAGSADSTSGYSPGVRDTYEGSVNTTRYLLTFENANHNAGAPIPAPKETRTLICGSPPDTWVCSEHYTDPVWDNVRMNNIAQHFATAFLNKYIKSNADMDPYLNLIPKAADGVISLNADGTPKSDHTYWKGFAATTAVGLSLEKLSPSP
jgi:predicted dienelactone hydrolase